MALVMVPEMSDDVAIRVEQADGRNFAVVQVPLPPRLPEQALGQEKGRLGVVVTGETRSCGRWQLGGRYAS
jgi:hypothetical protein